jgi:hypothetical protein
MIKEKEYISVSLSETKPDVQMNDDVVWFLKEDFQESSMRQIPIQVSEHMFYAVSSLESACSCRVILS